MSPSHSLRLGGLRVLLKLFQGNRKSPEVWFPHSHFAKPTLDLSRFLRRGQPRAIHQREIRDCIAERQCHSFFSLPDCSPSFKHTCAPVTPCCHHRPHFLPAPTGIQASTLCEDLYAHTCVRTCVLWLSFISSSVLIWLLDSPLTRRGVG